ncbi:MAG: hypothetical protein JWN48_1834 [Myxococcaceae bacterium]|nr:hypothetical protein [Myxococcaceae bacterium]
MTAPEDVGAVRRVVRRLAVVLEASEAQRSGVELAVTELGTNTLHHAEPPGHLIVQPLAPTHGRGLELLAVDHGPGIRDLRHVRHSTSPSAPEEPSGVVESAQAPPLGLGCGLDSVRRLASDFDLYSAAAQGTVVLARFHFEPPPRVPDPLRWGGVAVPLPGELHNGDGWASAPQSDGCGLMLADGLGHGPAAAAASEAACALFRRQADLDLEGYLIAANAVLRSTRGAALMVCRVYPEQGRLLVAGMGNVEGRLYLRGRSVGLSCRGGTLGMNLSLPKVSIRELAWEAGCTLVLHTDGVRHPFELSHECPLLQRDPTLIAAALHRDLGRARDDASVVVLRDLRSAR